MHARGRIESCKPGAANTRRRIHVENMASHAHDPDRGRHRHKAGKLDQYRSCAGPRLLLTSSPMSRRAARGDASRPATTAARVPLHERLTA
jgi:hypothetical protein